MAYLRKDSVLEALQEDMSSSLMCYDDEGGAVTSLDFAMNQL